METQRTEETDQKTEQATNLDQVQMYSKTQKVVESESYGDDFILDSRELIIKKIIMKQKYTIEL